MIETLITKIGLPALINIFAQALGQVDTPVTKGAAKALEDVGTAIRSGGISGEQLAEMNRHAEVMAQAQAEADKAAYEQVNESLRAEIASEDKYVRRMRPTFGYLMAVTWAAQMLGVAYVMIFETERAGEVMGGLGSLSAIWAVGLSVLGIYVYKRSEDKKLFPEQVIWNGPRQ